MIVKEELENNLIKTYSDQGYYIRGGFPEGLYAEAIDLEELGREYEETGIPIDDEATEQDYQEALKELGVNFDEEG